MREKMDEILNKVNDISNLVKSREDERRSDSVANVIVWLLLIVGLVAVVAALAYAVYSYMAPDYLEEFEDDFDPDDDFFEDEEPEREEKDEVKEEAEDEEE